jgi:hypothetical protein
MPGAEQSEFAFSEGSPEPEAAPHWRAEWVRRAEDLCRRLGVPLNHRAEVRLAQGPVLRGRLCLDEEQLLPDGNRHRLVLRIGRATFRLGEMESVMRMDDPAGAEDERRELPAAPRMDG